MARLKQYITTNKFDKNKKKFDQNTTDCNGKTIYNININI